MRATILVLAVALVLQSAPPKPPLDATPVLAAARAAIGGDAKLEGVRSFVVTGRTRRVRGKNLVPIEFEIACELPDKFVRKDEIPAEETGLMSTGFNGDRLIQSPAPDPGDEPSAAERGLLVMTAKQDFGRVTLGMFATSFAAFPLTFSYAGRAEAPDGAADAIDVKGPNAFAARLFINTSTHLPVMVTWQTTAKSGPVEHRLYYADYRDVGGLRWPFLIRGAVGGETVEETAVDRYRVNTKIDPKKFEAVK